MKTYVLCQRDGLDCYMAYEGMGSEEIAESIAGLGGSNARILDESEYAAAMQLLREAEDR